jgi:predicted RNase H-like nuclease (RuvC/YqgF family)
MAEPIEPVTPTEPDEKTYSEAEYNALQEQLTAAQESLKEATDKLASFENMDVEKIKQEAADWKQKYEQAEADRKEKEYNDNLDKFVQKQGMKNEIYADYLKRQLTEQKLQFDSNGNLVGGDVTVQDLRKSCPDAFAPNPNAPTSGHTSTTLDGVEKAFYAKNPDLMPEAK